MQEIILSILLLSFLEVVLGVDNIIFISLIANKVKESIRNKVRLFGLLLSLVLRLIMLFFIVLLLKLTEPIFILGSIGFSIKDIIMILGGIFLIIKASLAIYEELFILSDKNKDINKIKGTGVISVIVQIVLIDFVFSLDSLITAIGISQNYMVIATAIIVSILFMIAFAPSAGKFIEKYPELKVLVILFILLIGIILVLEGFSIHVDKSYLYFAMGFSLIAEILNIVKKKRAGK